MSFDLKKFFLWKVGKTGKKQGTNVKLIKNAFSKHLKCTNFVHAGMNKHFAVCAGKEGLYYVTEFEEKMKGTSVYLRCINVK